MREAFAHDAVLVMEPDADLGAPGAAITAALCGHWEHETPCPLAPHHTRAAAVEGQVRLRVLFVTEPERAAMVRHRIERALAEGRLPGAGGTGTRWRLTESRGSAVSPDELDHAARMMRD